MNRQNDSKTTSSRSRIGILLKSSSKDLSNFTLSRINSARKVFIHRVAPFLHETSDRIVGNITNDLGSDHWSALKPSNKWSRYAIRTLVGVAGFGIVWAMFAQIDEVVQATGKLEPLGTTLDIKAPMGGVIKAILVKDGELVEKDQILVELDTTAVKARLDALEQVKERTVIDLLLSKSQIGLPIDEGQLNSTQLLRLQSLRSEAKSRLSAAESNVISAVQQLNSHKEQLNAKKTALVIREKILSDIEPLAKQGAVSRSQYLKELQEVELLRGETKSIEATVQVAVAGVQEAKSRLENTKSLSLIDFTAKVEETEKQIAQLNNQISEAKVTLRYQALRAPKDGVVFDLQASTAGYVANNERPVLKLVPVDNLVARVFIPNRDIGFVKVGQSSKVRIDAFPSNEFGDIEGSISSIGSDVLEPDEQNTSYRFPVTIELKSETLSHKGKDLPLLSGMSVSANIILRQRPVIAIFTQKLLPFWDSLEKM